MCSDGKVFCVFFVCFLCVGVVSLSILCYNIILDKYGISIMYSLDKHTRQEANAQFIKDTWTNAPEKQGPERVVMGVFFLGFKEMCASLVEGTVSAVAMAARFASSQVRNLISSQAEPNRLTVSFEGNEGVASESADLQGGKQEVKTAKLTSVDAESNEMETTASVSLRF